MRLLLPAAALASVFTILFAAVFTSTVLAQAASGVGRVPGISVQPAPARPVGPPARPAAPPPPARHDTGITGHVPDLFVAGPRTYAPRFHRPFRRGIVPPAIVPYPSYFTTYPAYAAYQPIVILQDDDGMDPYRRAPELPRSEAAAAPAGATQEPAASTAPAPPAQPGVAAKPKTLYVIPRCYAGDRRPSADELPKGCDIRALRVIPPRS